MASTLLSYRSCTPRAWHAATSLLRTSRLLLLAGNHLLVSASAASSRPTCRRSCSLRGCGVVWCGGVVVGCGVGWWWWGGGGGGGAAGRRSGGLRRRGAGRGARRSSGPAAPPEGRRSSAAGGRAAHHARQLSRSQEEKTARSALGDDSVKKSRSRSTSTGSTLLRGRAARAAGRAGVCIAQLAPALRQLPARRRGCCTHPRPCTPPHAPDNNHTHQRLPPDMSIFLPASRVRSSTVTCAAGRSGGALGAGPRAEGRRRRRRRRRRPAGGAVAAVAAAAAAAARTLAPFSAAK
jgi:hypothetical protein